MALYLVTGGAGFIGSALVRALLAEGHAVRVLDDFSTGARENLAGLDDAVDVREGSICDEDALAAAMPGVDIVFHEAAIPSVPRSIKDPVASNRINIEGTVKVLVHARDARVRRVICASSSSVYGLAPEASLHEGLVMRPISPYAITKAAGEDYCRVFSGLYDLDCVSLRYFNVFGPRQDPGSPYAAVIPIFLRHLLRGESPPVHGDGLQARDFTYVDNVVQANLRAAAAPGRIAGAYNVACGQPVTLLELIAALNRLIGTDIAPRFGAARAGDIRRSCADIARARGTFGYAPEVTLEEGLKRTLAWMRGEELKS